MLKKLLFVLLAVTYISFMTACNEAQSKEEHNHTEQSEEHSHEHGEECDHSHEEEAHNHDHATEAHNHDHEHGEECDHSHEDDKNAHNHEAHSHEHDNHAGHEAENPNEVEFSLAMAKKVGLQTTKIKPVKFYDVIKTSGEILPARGDESIVVATHSGKVFFSGDLLFEGTNIRQNQQLFL